MSQLLRVILLFAGLAFSQTVKSTFAGDVIESLLKIDEPERAKFVVARLKEYHDFFSDKVLQATVVHKTFQSGFNAPDGLGQERQDFTAEGLFIASRKKMFSRRVTKSSGDEEVATFDGKSGRTFYYESTGKMSQVTIECDEPTIDANFVHFSRLCGLGAYRWTSFFDGRRWNRCSNLRRPST